MLSFVSVKTSSVTSAASGTQTVEKSFSYSCNTNMGPTFEYELTLKADVPTTVSPGGEVVLRNIDLSVTKSEAEADKLREMFTSNGMEIEAARADLARLKIISTNDDETIELDKFEAPWTDIPSSGPYTLDFEYTGGDSAPFIAGEDGELIISVGSFDIVEFPDGHGIPSSAVMQGWCETVAEEDYTFLSIPIVEDTEAPNITLIGDNPMEIEVGGTYDEPGAIAEDNVDGDLTEQIEINGEVNTGEPGTYIITYSVTDSSGNTSKVERTVIVVEASNGNDRDWIVEESKVIYACTVDLDITTIDFEMPTTIKATVPTWVEPGEEFEILESSATVEIPEDVVSSVQILLQGVKIDGIVPLFNVRSANEDQTINAAADGPIEIPETEIPRRGDLIFTAPEEGIDVGPFKAGQDGVVTFYAGEIDTLLNSYRADGSSVELPAKCAPKEEDSVLTTISIGEPDEEPGDPTDPDPSDPGDEPGDEPKQVNLGEEIEVSAGEQIIIAGTNTIVTMPEDLPAGTTVVVVDVSEEIDTEGFEAAGSVYDFTFTYPGGASPTGNFTLTMDYDNNSYSADEVDIYYYNEVTREWEKQNGTVDENAGTITITPSHFSIYGVLVEVDSGDPDPTDPTDPDPTDPDPTDPTDPDPTDPDPTDPTDPAPTDPTDPAPTDPDPTVPTDPAPTDPDPTVPTDPAPTDPTKPGDDTGKKDGDGLKLPKTATSLPTFLLIGSILLIVGVTMLLARRKKLLN